jgi:H+/Cl- antiporter ClcA
MAVRDLGRAVVSILRVALVAIVVGAILGVVMKSVLWLFDGTIYVLWDWLPEQVDVDPESFGYMVIVLGGGGLLVGIGQRFLGYHPDALDVVIEQVKEGEGIDYRTIPRTLLNSVFALGSGGPLGPEAALVAVIGGVYYWAKERMDKVALLAYHTVTGTGEQDTSKPWQYAPAVIAGIVLVLVFRALPGGVDLSYVPTSASPGAASAVLLAVAAGIAGGVLGLGSVHLEGRLRGLGLFDRAPLLTGVVGGLIVAILAVPSFLVLFSGAEQMGALFDGSTSTGEMFYAGVAKWAGLLIVITLGWKGGPIFPLMFISGALAVAAGDAFGVEGLALYAGGVAGAVTGGLRSMALGVLVALLVVPASMVLLMVAGAAGAGLVLRGERHLAGDQAAA